MPANRAPDGLNLLWALSTASKTYEDGLSMTRPSPDDEARPPSRNRSAIVLASEKPRWLSCERPKSDMTEASPQPCPTSDSYHSSLIVVTRPRWSHAHSGRTTGGGSPTPDTMLPSEPDAAVHWIGTWPPPQTHGASTFGGGYVPVEPPPRSTS